MPKQSQLNLGYAEQISWIGMYWLFLVKKKRKKETHKKHNKIMKHVILQDLNLKLIEDK